MSRPLRIYFRLAFALSWGIGGIELLTGILRHRPHPLPAANPLYFLAAYSVSLTGIALTAWYRGRGGLRRLGLRLIPWRSGALWYLIVVGGYAAITVLSMCVAALFGPTPNTLLNPAMFFHRLLPYIASDPGPVGEEFGWRGFALPLLLEQYSPLKASLILGVIHGLWHVPLFFIPGTTQSQLFFPIFMVGTISLAIIDTVLYLRTGANLLLAILVHVMSNSFCLGLSPYQISFSIAGEAALAGAMVLAGGLRSNEQRTAIHDHEADARALGSGGGGPG